MLFRYMDPQGTFRVLFKKTPGPPICFNDQVTWSGGLPWALGFRVHDFVSSLRTGSIYITTTV